MKPERRPERIWILGAGRFGRRALDTLLKRFPSASVTVVDRNPEALKACFNTEATESTERNGGGRPEPFHGSPRIKRLPGEGIGFLKKHLKEDAPDWIVPAIPVHVAFEWLKSEFESSCRLRGIPVPGPVFDTLPNPVRGRNRAVYMSNADFICPENCPEPETICTCTGKPRPRILHAVLAAVKHRNFRSIVVLSRQLAPGVGGYPPQALFEAHARVQASEAPILLSTACKCHGVMHAARILRS